MDASAYKTARVEQHVKRQQEWVSKRDIFPGYVLGVEDVDPATGKPQCIGARSSYFAVSGPSGFSVALEDEMQGQGVNEQITFAGADYYPVQVMNLVVGDRFLGIASAGSALATGDVAYVSDTRGELMGLSDLPTGADLIQVGRVLAGPKDTTGTLAERRIVVMVDSTNA